MDNTVITAVPSSSSSKPTSSKVNKFDGGNNSSDKPIRFVYCDEDDNGKFKLDPDAINVLNQIQGPVAVVSVCGPPRQGKSFVLNQLLGRSSGFQVVPTLQPWTTGLWIWSTPLKRTTLDGTEYNLLLMDSGGSNGHDQTGMHSTQIFSLAVLVSSLFIYNQVGLIDEAALDHLSLITEMTKHIHGRASKGNDSVSKIGHFSPVFIWLLRDFYLDLKENDRKIIPRDYLELSLRPIMGNGKDIAAKNQIRESIRAVFPNRECFALVRPLNNEIELEHLDQVTLDKLRPEFQSGLNIFTKFVHERTRPKQVGGTVMTGPFLAHITKSLIDVLNDGVFPTISSSWQLHPSNAFMEADLQCSNAIQLMETKLEGACQVPNARIENVTMVLESLISEYKASADGPVKWQKLSSFLQKSLQGTILQQVKKQIDEISSENKSLVMKCRQLDDKIEVLQNQLQANEKSKAECQKCYENAINDFQKLSDQYKNHIKNLESKCRVLEEQHSRSLEMLDTAKQVSLEWERKYEEILTQERAANHRDDGQTEVHKSRIFKAAEESKLAWKKANELKEKYEVALNEAKISLKKAAEEAMLREEDLTARFNKSLAEKEEEMKEKITKLEQAETKIGNSELELSDLKLQMKELSEKYESVKSAAQSMESETQRLVEERIQLEQKYLSELKSVEEARLRDKVAEEEAKMANVLNIQNEKVTVDRFAQTESEDIHIETSEREKTELAGEVEMPDASDGNASSKVALLEATVRERDQEIELLKKKCEQLEFMRERLNILQRDLTPDNSNDSEMDSGLKTYSGMKRPRLDVLDAVFDEEIASETKETRTPSALQRCTTTPLAESVFTSSEADTKSQEAASVDYTKFTVMKLKQELKGHGFDDELQKLKHPKKKDILHLYKKLVLKM